MNPSSSTIKNSKTVVPACELLGCKIHAIPALDLVSLIQESVESGAAGIIANHNLHSLYLYHHDQKLRRFYAKANWIHVDGMGVVLLARTLGIPLAPSTRITYVDLLPLILRRAQEQYWKIFYLGSKPGVAEKGFARLKQRFPRLRVATAHGYFESTEEAKRELLNQIRAFAPNVLMVGMGMPLQEHWIAENYDKLGNAVILPCGAAIDYFAGAIPTPPRWAGRLGLEWLFRLRAEPTRLWKRYLVEPWFLLFLTASHWARAIRSNRVA
jgi:N-acetylglucosaminyldiphosphoundecaprenol N-acetyl-beta-D-mannosaminyltransferase